MSQIDPLIDLSRREQRRLRSYVSRIKETILLIDAMRVNGIKQELKSLANLTQVRGKLTELERCLEQDIEICREYLEEQ